MNKNKLLLKIGNDKKTLLIVGLGILGIIFLLLSCFLPSGNSAKSDEEEFEFASLEERTEKKLEDLLTSVRSAGRVKVIVTYECAEAYEYASNEKAQGDEKNDKEYVIIDCGNDDGGLRLCVTAPKVRGVAVCCDGASSAAVREELTGMICAALGIGANRVYITQMKE